MKLLTFILVSIVFLTSSQVHKKHLVGLKITNESRMKIGETFPEMEEEAESMKKDEEVHSVNWVERLFQRSLWMRNTEHFYNDIVNQVHPDQKIKSNSRKLSSCFTTCFSNGGCDVECPLCIENICVAEQRSGDNRDSCDHECSLSSPTSSCGGNCNECRAHQVQGVRLDYGRCVDPGSIDRSKCGVRCDEHEPFGTCGGQCNVCRYEQNQWQCVEQESRSRCGYICEVGDDICSGACNKCRLIEGIRQCAASPSGELERSQCGLSCDPNKFASETCYGTCNKCRYEQSRHQCLEPFCDRSQCGLDCDKNNPSSTCYGICGECRYVLDRWKCAEDNLGIGDRAQCGRSCSQNDPCCGICDECRQVEDRLQCVESGYRLGGENSQCGRDCDPFILNDPRCHGACNECRDDDGLGGRCVPFNF
mmetsp:Transcript_48323/g.71620  ORF Transcript_48323/g.71620 Transcript_48323/m.71620 type:complete len:421 (+) Transcript_48323:106-1368(+)